MTTATLDNSSIPNKSGLKAVGKAILCRPYHPEFDSSIIAIPDHVKALELMREMRATVIQIGANAWANEPPRAAIGDRVLVSQYSGAIVKGTADGELYRICNDQDIFCQIESGDMADMIPEDPVLKTKRLAKETERVAGQRR